MADNKKSSISKRSSCYLLNLKQPDKTARRLKLSFQRISATVGLAKSDRTVEASVGFLDVSETGAGVFTPELLNKGSVVELCITEPMILKVRGIVAWSAPISSGIHQGKFKCRSGIQFVFDGETQRESVKDFVKKANSDPIENLKAMTTLAPTPPAFTPGNNTGAELVAATAELEAKAAAAAPPVAEAPPPVADAPAAATPAPESPPAPDATSAAPVAEAPAAAPEAAAVPEAEKKAA